MRRLGPYQLQAAIAVMHAQAAGYADTDWPQIRLLYDRLLEHTPTPVVRLNRAVATRYAVGPQAALAEVEPLAATWTATGCTTRSGPSCWPRSAGTPRPGGQRASAGAGANPADARR